MGRVVGRAASSHYRRVMEISRRYTIEGKAAPLERDQRRGQGGAVWNERGELNVVVNTWRLVVRIEGGSSGRFLDRIAGETKTNQKLNVLRIGLRSTVHKTATESIS